jgi:hypothetical protein
MKQTPQQWSLKSSFIYWIQLICFIAAQMLQRFSNCLPCGKCFGFFSTIFVEQTAVYVIMWQMYGARCTPDTKCVLHDVDKEGCLFLFTIARNWPLYLYWSSEHGNAHKNAARDNCISTNCSSWFYLARNDLSWKQVLGLITSRLGSKAAKPSIHTSKEKNLNKDTEETRNRTTLKALWSPNHHHGTRCKCALVKRKYHLQRTFVKVWSNCGRLVWLCHVRIL